MKKLIFVLLAIAFVFSCQKKDTDITTQVFQQVSFNTSEILPETGRDEWPCKEVDPTNAWVQILLVGETTPTNYYLELFSVGGKLYTQSVKLAIGNYQVVQFILYQEVNGTQGVQAEDIVTHGTPVQGSEFAGYVNVSLPIDFVVAEFEKTEIPIEVLCFIDAEYLAFGFEWFEITIIELDQLCFFGDICLNGEPFIPADFEPQYGTGLGIDVPAIMEIVVKQGDDVVAEFNNELAQTVEPLCVPYDADEDYTFELYLWLPGDYDGSFSYQLYDTYTYTNGVLDIDIGDDFILDFFVGTCGYGDADQTFDFIWTPPVPPVAGDLVITEIMKDPDVVTDANGEWFEVYNTTDHAIEMMGLIVSDLGTNAFEIDESLIILPNGFLVLGRNSDVGTNGGITIDFEWTSFELGNSDDEIIITTADQLEIDRVEYDGGPNFPDPNGASMSLDPGSFNTTANDDGANWCEATSPYGGGDLGTPGLLNNDCPLPAAPPTEGDLVITEIMANPDVISDSDGEWFEVYNATDHPIEMEGVTIIDLANNSDIIEGSLIIPSNSYFVLGLNADIVVNGGVSLNYVYGGNVSLNNGNEELSIFSADMVLIDHISYASASSGKSRSLDPGFLNASDNDIGANWCNSTSPNYHPSNTGTPGSANVSCP